MPFTITNHTNEWHNVLFNINDLIEHFLLKQGELISYIDDLIFLQ